MEELIVSKARTLFFSYGLKSVSMDDISKEAAISKKTIYKSFEDKNQLIERLITDLLDCSKQLLVNCRNKAKHAIEEVVLFTQAPVEIITDITPSFFYELKKSFPDLWKMMEEHKQHVITPFIIQNLHTGIEEGLFRSDIDKDFTACVRLQQLQFIIDKSLDEQPKTPMAIDQLTLFYLHAITTEKGTKILNQYINMNNENRVSN